MAQAFGILVAIAVLVGVAILLAIVLCGVGLIMIGCLLLVLLIFGAMALPCLVPCLIPILIIWAIIAATRGGSKSK